MDSTAFRVLSNEEEEKFRQWARDNYEPSTEPRDIWHPAIKDEWRRIQQERREGFTDHYHVNVSSPGGFVGDDQVVADDENDLLTNALNVVQGELRIAIECEFERGETMGNEGFYEEGWKAWDKVNELEVDDLNATNLLEQWTGRKHRAPAYTGPNGTAALRKSILNYLDSMHLRDMEFQGTLRMVVARCSELACLEVDS